MRNLLMNSHAVYVRMSFTYVHDNNSTCVLYNHVVEAMYTYNLHA